MRLLPIAILFVTAMPAFAGNTYYTATSKGAGSGTTPFIEGCLVGANHSDPLAYVSTCTTEGTGTDGKEYTKLGTPRWNGNQVYQDYQTSGGGGWVYVQWSTVKTCTGDDVFNDTTGLCEAPGPVCTAGQSISWGGASTDTACSGGCLVTTVGVSIQLEDGGLWLGDWQQTGEQCTDQPPHTPDTPQVDLLGNNCVTNSKGDQLCIDKQAPNCGYVNGVYTCLDSLPPGTCYVLSGGSYVCDSSSTTPPAPNNGTPGVKAPSDLKMQIAAAGASSEYFGVDTVGASSGSVDSSGNYTPGASGPAAGGSTSTSGSGSGETETATPAAPGDFPALGGEGTGPGTVAANLGQLGTALFGAGSMYDTVTNVGLNTPAGSCPTASFEFQTTTFTIDGHCSLYESVAPTLQLVFSAIWALSAVVVVMRA